MAKHVKIVRTFPNSWYKFIVEGDATGLSDSERMIAESALSKAFPDGGDIIAARIGTKRQKYSTLVCESYSINGCPDKTEGKTFKVKVLADEDKNPKTYKQYVQEDIKTLQDRRSNAPDYDEEKDKDSEAKGGQETSRKGTNAEDDISLVGRVAGYEPSRFDVTARVYDEWKQVFGTELNKDENAGKTDDGSDTITHEKAALLLQSEIIKAVEANDKERLKELRQLLPLLAWYASKYKRHYTTLFNSMLTQGDQLKMSAYHKLIEVLPTVYDVAFDLDESEEAKQEAAKYVGKGKKLISRENLGDTPEERKEYAVDVFNKVIYGTALPEACAKTVTQSLASTQQYDLSRSERSDYRNFYEGFIKWFNENKDSFGLSGTIRSRSSAIDENEFAYAQGLYYIDTIWNTVIDVEEDFQNVSDSTALTQTGLENAFSRIVAFDTDDGKKEDTQEEKCFKGILVEVWTAAGLNVTTKTSKGGRTKKILNGAYPGDFASFKKDFHVACESVKTKLERMLASFTNEYEAFKEEHDEKVQSAIDKIENGQSIKGEGAFGEFDADESKVLGPDTKDRQWIEDFAPDHMTRFALQTSMFKFINNQHDQKGGHVVEIGLDSTLQQNVTTGSENVGARGEVGGGGMESTEDQREQDDIGRGDVSGDEENAIGGSVGPVSYDEHKDDGTINFTELNEKLIGSENHDVDDENVKKRAKDLNINPERAVKIAHDWKAICDAEGGLGQIMNIARTKQGGKSKSPQDVDSRRIREEADKLINAEEEKREAAYDAAKTAYDDAKDGGDKDEIRLAKSEFENAKKNRKLSSKEKAEIVRKVRYADVGKGINIQSDLTSLTTDEGGALADGARKIGRSALMKLFRHFGYMIATEGTPEDTYKGLPDLLVLLMHDKIMKYHKENPDESLETCIDRVSRDARSEFIKFSHDMCKLNLYVPDLTMKSESAGDDDKFLTSVEQMLDLIENSDLDAQAKLDMLDALELSFALWCEKNEVVPETINPEEDEDAVKNHPEDAE